MKKFKNKVMSISLAVGMMAIGLSSNSLFADSYACRVSSDPSNNDGHCKALSSGNGDMCFTYGSGPACSGTITTTNPDPDVPEIEPEQF